MLIHGPNIPGSCAILFFIASGFTFTTRLIHNGALFQIWLRLFIPSGAVSLLFSSSILDTYLPGIFTVSVISFCLFILLMGFSRQEWWSGLPFPSPGDHVLSEFSTKTHPFWVAMFPKTSFPNTRKNILITFYSEKSYPLLLLFLYFIE